MLGFRLNEEASPMAILAMCNGSLRNASNWGLITPQLGSLHSLHSTRLDPAQEMAFTVTVRPRSSKPSKRFPLTVELAASKPTVRDLKRAIAAQANASPLSTLE